MDREVTGHLVSIVGSNPMSSLSAISTMRPNEVTLVHTPETFVSAGRLADALDQLAVAGDRGEPEFRVNVSLLEVPATNALRVRELLEDLEGPWALDYTGGTKAMSCGARLAYEYRGPRIPAVSGGGADPAGALYVDDHQGLVRSDDGGERQLDEHLMRLKTIAQLHGCELDFTKCYQPQKQWATGGWSLENKMNRVATNWLSKLNDRLGGDPPPQAVLQNLLLVLAANRKAELDVVVHRGRRIGIISCYAGATEPTKEAKMKLFEAMERGRQLGGDLTRIAIAAELKPDQVAMVKDDLGPRWNPRSAAVFGTDDVAALERGDYSALDEWWGVPG